MDSSPYMEIVVNASINQIDRFVATLPNRILEEELQFDLEAMLTSLFDHELDLFMRKSEIMGMTEIMFIPLIPLQAMFVEEIKEKLKGLEEWIQKRLCIKEVEVFLTFEDPPRSELELFEQTTQIRRAQALLERIARK